MVLKDHIRKVNIPGTASCILCSVDIEYTQGGLGTIKQHVQQWKHLKNLSAALRKKQIIPGASMPEAANAMYGAPPVYCEASTSPCNTSDVPPTTTVHILDRVVNMETMVVAFLAENSLLLTLSDKLIELSLELSKDIPALKKLQMHCTTASYKLTHGLALVWENELIDHMKVVPFSLNMDESTSANTKHVFSILVCYYNGTTKRIAVQHLGSVDVPSCTSENLYNETKKLFLHHSLLWKKLIALLADSANLMRGKIYGVETLIRTRDASHILDFHGESCHHMHNAVKKVTSFLDYYLENLFRDISSEFKYCADSLFLLEEVTFHMDKKFRKPITYNVCRCLSVYDVSVEFDGRFDVYRVFSAFEKADIQLKIKACNNELKNLNCQNNQLNKQVNTSKTKEEFEKQRSKLEKSV